MVFLHGGVIKVDIPTGNTGQKKFSARGIKKVKCSDCKHLYFMGSCSVLHSSPNPQAYRICSRYTSL